MAYLLDANVFIQAKNLHYGLDFCPAFWEWLVQENGNGKVLSVGQVGDELLAGDDELAEWAKHFGTCQPGYPADRSQDGSQFVAVLRRSS